VSCLAAAQREVREETGVAELLPLGVRGVPGELVEGIFDVDVHQIPANSREGAHAHFDVRYAFEARAAQLYGAGTSDPRGISNSSATSAA